MAHLAKTSLSGDNKANTSVPVLFHDCAVVAVIKCSILVACRRTKRVTPACILAISKASGRRAELIAAMLTVNAGPESSMVPYAAEHDAMPHKALSIVAFVRTPIFEWANAAPTVFTDYSPSYTFETVCDTQRQGWSCKALASDPDDTPLRDVLTLQTHPLLLAIPGNDKSPDDDHRTTFAFAGPQCQIPPLQPKPRTNETRVVFSIPYWCLSVVLTVSGQRMTYCMPAKMGTMVEGALTGEIFIGHERTADQENTPPHCLATEEDCTTFCHVYYMHRLQHKEPNLKGHPGVFVLIVDVVEGMLHVFEHSMVSYHFPLVPRSGNHNNAFNSALQKGLVLQQSTEQCELVPRSQREVTTQSAMYYGYGERFPRLPLPVMSMAFADQGPDDDGFNDSCHDFFATFGQGGGVQRTVYDSACDFYKAQMAMHVTFHVEFDVERSRKKCFDPCFGNHIDRNGPRDGFVLGPSVLTQSIPPIPYQCTHIHPETCPTCRKVFGQLRSECTNLFQVCPYCNASSVDKLLE